MNAPRNPPRNILLVYPETPRDTYWSFSHALGMIGKKVSTPPLGLLTVAAMLPAESYDVRLVDMNVTPLGREDVEWADMVFVSSMIAQKESLEAILPVLRAAGKTIVAGGPHTSTAYRETPHVDCFVIGEAEGTWPQFLADLGRGALRPAYAAPVREQEAEALREYFGPEAHIALSPAYPDVNLAPVPRYDLLRSEDYSLMPVQASRGCPVGCEFCDIWRRFGRRTRIKDTERILAELEAIYRQGWRDTVFLVDDNFIGDRKRAKELLRALTVWQRERDWPFAFLTESTLSLADDPELLSLMAGAGFNSVFVGIETPAHESLHETRKHINTTGSMGDKVAAIQRRGIQIMSGFIIGFDSDPEDIAERMSACIQEMGIPQAMIGLLSALPDTDLYERLEKAGRVRSAASGNNTHGFTMNFQPVRPVEAVVGDYKRVLDAAYSRNMKGFFQRCAVLRSRWPRKREHTLGYMSLSFKAKALVRYLAAAGKSSYRFQALWFLLVTLLTKPSFFAEAVTLGIKGHHLWVITRQAFEVEGMREFMLDGVRKYAAFLQSRREALGPLVARAGAGLGTAGEDLRQAWTALRSSPSVATASDELRTLYRRAEETVREADLYRIRVQREAERRFHHLSRETRRSLSDEMRVFSEELDQLFRGLRVEVEPVRSGR